MVLRRLGAIALDPAFSFDGNTSDLAQQYYRRHVAGDVSHKLTLASAVLPEAIQTRLTAIGASFTDLPGLLQRAVIWDSGFALSPRNELIRVQTLDGVSMAQIAVSKSDYLGAGCTAQNCTQPDGRVWFKSLECNGAQMNGISRCLADDFDWGGEVHMSMWSTGGDDTLIPEIMLRKHVWTDGGNSYIVPAIHTAKSGSEQAYLKCQGDDGNRVGSIVIACYPPSKIGAEMLAKMKPPAQSTIVTQWLVQHKQETDAKNKDAGDGSATNGGKDKDGFNMMLLVPILIAVLVLVLGAVFWICRRKRRRAQGMKTPSSGMDPAPLITPRVTGFQESAKHTGTGTGHGSGHGTGTGSATASSAGMATTMRHEHIDDYDSGSSNSVMKILLGDQILVEQRLEFELIEFDHLLSKGAFGEVWVCHYDGQVVAVKRLLQNKQHSFQDVEDFTHEIQLSASLRHPNIVGFLGVAWNSLENLVMAMEYLPRGDLQGYLRKNGDSLSWSREKMKMARGMASALMYMHTRSPVLIHRDLKSKNVLLSDTLEAKLIDFGVSRGKKDLTMTAGVGTPFWTAPEVLEGTRYTEKSDIYSFGVLLTELDTCKIPYKDATGPEGEPLKHFQILNFVMAGTLRPSVSLDCPGRIRKTVAMCVQHDPVKRPSATELLQLLVGE